jgi:hypothetical protein
MLLGSRSLLVHRADKLTAIWADCLDNVEFLTSNNPIDLYMVCYGVSYRYIAFLTLELRGLWMVNFMFQPSTIPIGHEAGCDQDGGDGGGDLFGIEVQLFSTQPQT